MRFRLGELFCGPGGIAWGALNAPLQTNQNGEEFSIAHAWANDYDFDTCCTYSHNICNIPVNNQDKLDDLAPSVYCEDVRQFDLSKLISLFSVLTFFKLPSGLKKAVVSPSLMMFFSIAPFE